MSRLSFSPCAALIFSVAFLFPYSAIAEPIAATLVAARECPAKGEHRACLMTSSLLPESEYPTIGDYVHPEDLSERSPEPRVLRLRGRLNGGDVLRYRLKLRWPEPPTDQDEPQVTAGYPPALPYLGQSRSDHPIVLTTSGALEIVSRDYHGPSSETYLIDETRWKIIGTLMYAENTRQIVTSADDIGLWDDKRDLCVTAIFKPRERLRLLDNGCMARLPSPGKIDIDIAARHRAYVEKVKTAALEMPVKLLHWLDAWNRAVHTGLSTEFIYKLNYGIANPLEQVEPTAVLYENADEAPIELRHLRRLLPRWTSEEMGPDDSVATFFGGSGVGISISRIRRSHILIVNVSYDDC